MNASTVAIEHIRVVDQRRRATSLKDCRGREQRLSTTTPKKAVAMTLMPIYRSIIFIKKPIDCRAVSDVP